MVKEQLRRFVELEEVVWLAPIPTPVCCSAGVVPSALLMPGIKLLSRCVCFSLRAIATWADGKFCIGTFPLRPRKLKS